MSGPRAKRQFAGAAADPSQRQITNYFTSSPTTTASPRLPPSSSPVSLPASVQASLLNVGMRIRKSVPEGYKTGSAYSGFKLWDEREEDDGAASRRRAKVVATVAQRELMPFCGIHSVGGLSAQPAFDEEEDRASSGLTSSQESVESILEEEVANVKKRGYVDDEDEEDQVPLRIWNGVKDWIDADVSPRTVLGDARAMAVPRRRTGRKSAGGSGPGLGDPGQENMVVDDDFGEAAFLDAAVFGEEMDI